MNKSYSLQKRLLINTSLVLVFFIAAMSVVLLKSYETGIRQATFERLTAHFYSLLSVTEQYDSTEVDSEGFRENLLFIPEEPQLDQRFNQFASGLSALVFDETETLVWNSISANHKDIKLPLSLPGSPMLYEDLIDGDEYFKFHFVTEWESDAGNVSLYHFVVLENKRAFNQVVGAYRNQLLVWLCILGLSLLFVIYLMLRWTFKPITKMSDQLSKVKQGLVEKLDNDYPIEVQVLTDNINRFIDNERDQSKRYKETLANLAHSLKTPLAVMQSALQNDSSKDELAKISKEQLQRMNQIVGYQLQRATSGPQVMMKSILLEPAITKLVSGLTKVYRDKGIEIETSIENNLAINLNEGDLYEVCGNLLDNACKWADRKVKFTAKTINGRANIVIEDDGPGIPESVRESVLSRGKRLDETVDGQGIGMSVVKEILEAYKAEIKIGTSASLQGASIELSF